MVDRTVGAPPRSNVRAREGGAGQNRAHTTATAIGS